jgi:hypothetical protein
MIAPHIIEHLQRGSGWPLKTLSFNKQGHKFQKLTPIVINETSTAGPCGNKV